MATLNELMARAEVIRADCAERLFAAGRIDDGNRVAGCPIVWGPKMTRVAGYAQHNKYSGFVRVRLSKPLFSRPENEKDFEETVRHEFAHIAETMNCVQAHGWQWRRTCLALGGNGERCHKMKVLPHRQLSKVTCACLECGTRFLMGPAQASAAQKGQRNYWCNSCYKGRVVPPYGWTYAAARREMKLAAQNAAQ